LANELRPRAEVVERELAAHAVQHAMKRRAARCWWMTEFSVTSKQMPVRRHGRAVEAVDDEL